MKVLKFTFPVLLVAVLLFSSCGGPKEATDARNSELMERPCHDDEEFYTDDKYFRASQTGESSDMSTAKKIARQNARSQLASDIESTLKRTMDIYAQQQDLNDKQEVKKKVEDISRTVVRQELRDVRTNCTKVTKNKDDGDYTFYVNVEMSKKAYLEGFQDQISKQEEL